MASLRARPAHAPGPTFLAYTPNGQKLITVGTNDSILIFDHGSDGEPTRIDDAREGNLCVVATNDFLIAGSEDGTVCKYSLATNTLDQTLVRCTLPIRDLSLSPDKQWVAVASDELVVKVVNTSDMDRVHYLREQDKPVKHVSYDYSGSYLMASCTDGVIYVYSMSEEEPRVIKKIDGLIRRIETDDDSSSKAVWHPDGRSFAAAMATRDIQVMSKRDWERQRGFKSGHAADITAMAWSPNGALLISASKDEKVTVWETRSQKIVQRIDGGRGTVQAFSWHPTDNVLSYTNTNGELYIHTDFLDSENARQLSKTMQPSPFIHDPLAEISANLHRANGAGRGKHDIAAARRVIPRGTPDSDDLFGSHGGSDDGFLEDDDGAGYAEEGTVVSGHNKRRFSVYEDGVDGDDSRPPKRRAPGSSFRPRIHESFQPGSTPWRGNRRYLCLNLIGFVWTVDQDTHHTVTVEFYDREFQRDFHFTDPYAYDKACLTEKGTLFSSQPSGGEGTKHQPAMLHYRPHEHWTSERYDWRVSLPKGERVVAIALSDGYVVCCTSANYVRVYTLFGVPVRVYRAKSSPIVTCASWRDYIMTVGNGPIAGDGWARVTYSIWNVKRDAVCQSEDTVALPEGARIQNVFFSDAGDPCIYDTTHTLLTLLHWRHPSQAQWLPVLTTTSLQRLASGRKTETYWPVAVADNKFHCIILKGGERHPYFPRPLLSEFDFEVPVHDPAPSISGKEDDQGRAKNGLSETQQLESQHVLLSTLHALASDTVSSTSSTASQRASLSRTALEIDKTLLQMLAAECVAGEERGMRALEIVELLRDEDDSGKVLDAAGKVARRFGRQALGERIEEIVARKERERERVDEMNVDGEF